MYNQDYITQVQQKLTDKYKNNIDDKDDHKVTVFTSSHTGNAIIAYHPNWLDNHNDNNGEIEPVSTIYITAFAKEYPAHDIDSDKSIFKFNKLENNYFIHGQKFDSNHYDLNLNYRNHNALDSTSQKKLTNYLKKKFDVILTNSGVLTINITKDDVVSAFDKLIKAIQYVCQYGHDYVINGNPVLEATKSLAQEEHSVEQASNAYKKSRHHSNEKHMHKSNRPKAPGKIVAGYSSVAGTTREKRYAHERKQRAIKKAKQQKFLKEHPEKAKAIKKAKIKKQRALRFKNKFIVTSGRFSKPLPKIKALIKKHGAVVQSNLTKKTDYLLCDKPNKSKKFLNAKKRHIPMITEKDLEK